MVEIVTYSPKYADVFKTLNYAWIEEFFTIEEFDKIILEDPDGQIIRKGGEILVAILDGKPVGVCALIKTDEDLFELAKMAVANEARGQKIGLKLGIGIIEKAREFGAKKLFLETNSKLGPAISLYQKLGFKNSTDQDGVYDRCNIKMEFELK